MRVWTRKGVQGQRYVAFHLVQEQKNTGKKELEPMWYSGRAPRCTWSQDQRASTWRFPQWKNGIVISIIADWPSPTGWAKIDLKAERKRWRAACHRRKRIKTWIRYVINRSIYSLHSVYAMCNRWFDLVNTSCGFEAHRVLLKRQTNHLRLFALFTIISMIKRCSHPMLLAHICFEFQDDKPQVPWSRVISAPQGSTGRTRKWWRL